MAYATKYQIQFSNRFEQLFTVSLLLKDYTGAITQLTGASDTFILSYQSGDESIINPLRPSECTINFFNDGATPLTTFYSEDDEAWKIQINGNHAGEDIFWMGFLVQDDCREIFQDPPHIISLKGTDNLALLKDIPFNEAWQAETTETVINELTYSQYAQDVGQGRTTLGINFVSSTESLNDFEAGNSQYIGLADFIPADSSLWIIKNGSTSKTFRIHGIISVNFLDDSQNFYWFVETNAGVQTILIPNTFYTENINYNLPFDVTVTLAPGERLFALGWSPSDLDSSKRYSNSTWFISLPTSYTTNILEKLSLFDYIKFSLIKTGIDLPLNIYSNIYENSMPDRVDDPAGIADTFKQTHLFSGMFLSDDGTWENCYSILEKILFALNATLFLTRGEWRIIRWPELKLFTNNQIPGTRYNSDFSVWGPTQLNSDENWTIQPGGGLCFINADAEQSILRPFKNVKFTFNYEQPKGLIYGSDLKQTGSFIDYSDEVIDDITYRYDNYQLPIQWRHADSDTSYIRIVTDTTTDPETEKERYIITPGSNVETRGVRFNDIEVSAGDSFDLTLEFRLPQDVSDDVWVFAIKFYLQTINGDFYNLAPNQVGDIIDPLLWVKNWNADYTYPISVKKDTDSSQWMNWSLEHYLSSVEGKKIPLIPEDGVLVITVTADNYSTSAGGHTSYWKDIELRFLNFINQSTQITGQTHLTSVTNNIKNKFDDEIEIDDSPRSPIAGTLFTDQLIDFGGDIGSKYFIKTKAWHRSGITETRRLSEITTMEREQIASVPRMILEGTLDNTILMNIISVLQVDALPGINFITGIFEHNFFTLFSKVTLWEIYKTDEADADMTYTFEYIYKTS